MKQAILRAAIAMAVCAAGCSDRSGEPEPTEQDSSPQGTQDAGQPQPPTNEVVITGRLVSADGSPLPRESVWGLFGKKQSIRLGKNGVLLNPTAKTDEQGSFTLKLDRTVLEDEQEEVVIALDRVPPGDVFSRSTPLTNDKGVPIGLVFKPGVGNVDLGTITVK